MTINPNASALGKLAAGKPKRFTAAELRRRTVRLVAARRRQAKEQRRAAKAREAGKSAAA